VVSRKDLVLGTVIALAMGTTFVFLSSGLSLIVTFVPGIAATWLTFAWLYAKRVALPQGREFIPAFAVLLAVQFLHFAEEFATGFRTQFPLLYDGAPYSANLFVIVNMCAYFAFTIACLLAFETRRWFLLVPAIFFIIYGAIGNAISHSWWSLYLGAYFPGLVTAQAYWVMGPLVLHKLLGRRVAVFAVVGLFALVLMPLLTMSASPAALRTPARFESAEVVTYRPLPDVRR
jgi:hypothetical protein